MTRDEQIISTAKQYYPYDINCHNAFLHGVEWADEHPINIWHDASEMPVDNSRIVILYQYEIEGFNDVKMRDFPIHYFAHYDWARIVKRNFIKKWAYISDLLPKGGKK